MRPGTFRTASMRGLKIVDRIEASSPACGRRFQIQGVESGSGLTNKSSTRPAAGNRNTCASCELPDRSNRIRLA